MNNGDDKCHVLVIHPFHSKLVENTLPYLNLIKKTTNCVESKLFPWQNIAILKKRKEKRKKNTLS
jgi:hypothetical protein